MTLASQFPIFVLPRSSLFAPSFRECDAGAIAALREKLLAFFVVAGWPSGLVLGTGCGTVRGGEAVHKIDFT